MPASSHPVMKRPIIPAACFKPKKEPFLNRILLRCGSYFHPADLFLQELWKQRLVHIGFRVLLVQKLPIHQVWEIRLCGSLAAQTYLLVSKAVPKKDVWSTDLVRKQLQSEVHQIAIDLGLPIQRDCITVARTGKAYFTIAFIWPKGKPGLLLKKERKPEAFSFLIKPWLRRNRN
jgi:hypothetical protein